MSKHSKNSCAHPVFSYAERKKLKWGTSKVRIGSDSVKPYDHCTLCLHQAREPMICPKGHLYCKSCIYEHLLTQKSYIKQQMAAWEEQEKKQNIKGASEEEKQRLAEIAKFDQSQSSINTNLSKQKQPIVANAPKGYTAVTTASGSTAYIADRDLNTRLSSTSATSAEKQEKQKIMPCFWIPQMTPDAGVKKIGKPSEHTVCPDGQHTLRLKQLRVVRFTPAGDRASNSGTTPSASTPSLSSTSSTTVIPHMCASCRKTLNNAVKCSCLTTCGHVLCHTCVEQFVKKDGACSQCGTECSPRDVISLLTGTGFASSGGKVVTSQLSAGFVC